VITALIAALSIGAVEPPVHRSAIIVGVNQAFDETTPTLKYADDDAARYYELLSGRVARASLLTVLDAESQGLFGDVAAIAEVPDAAGLDRALAAAAKAAAEARAAGRRTELYFVYVGHGRVVGGDAEVRLRGGRMTRVGLAKDVLQSRDYDRIHVIIDACNAYHMINARGDDAPSVTTAFDDDFERFVADRSEAPAPTVGVVLATSGLGAVHEWSRYQGGVFSHEIRSALTGAADADGDGRVEYAEVEAFVAAANAEVPALKGRPRVYVRPPAIERAAALVDVDPSAPRLELPPSFRGHFYLEDDRGLRYAELNKAGGHPVALTLVPRVRYALLTAKGAPVATFEAPTGAITVSWPLTAGEVPQRQRGDDVPPGAFATPFGPSFVGGFRAKVEADAALVANAPLPALSPVVPAVGYSLAVLGAAAGGLAAWQASEASDNYQLYLDTYDMNQRDALAQDVRDGEARALGLGISAGVSIATAIALLVWDATF